MRSTLELRARIVAQVRRFFEARGSLEVETPQRVRSPGTEVHLEAEPAGEWYLITSPELHMKRLLAAGYPRIHQLCHCFRRNEQGGHHNSEFTMLEWYVARASYEDLMNETAELVTHVSQAVLNRTTISFGAHTIDLAPPWDRMTVADAFERYAGWRPGPDPDGERFYHDLVDRVECRFNPAKPLILYDYPASMASLARLKPTDSSVAERFEVYIGGLELANAFGELSDEQEQRRRCHQDLQTRQRLGLPAYPLDEKFLAAVGHLPPCSGIAFGIDRLVMLLANEPDIRNVMAFPQSEV